MEYLTLRVKTKKVMAIKLMLIKSNQMSSFNKTFTQFEHSLVHQGSKCLEFYIADRHPVVI